MIIRRPGARAGAPLSTSGGRTPVPSSVVVAGVVLASVVLTGCGTTYVDTTISTSPVTDAPSLPPVAADTPLPDLFAELDALMRRLDEKIVEADGDQAALARIDEVWAVAEAQIRDRDPDDLYAFEQAVVLATSGVERRRPADASKGYKLLVQAIEQYNPPA